MIEFSDILCPIDFSDTSVRALAYATTVVRRYDAQCTDKRGATAAAPANSLGRWVSRRGHQFVHATTVRA